MGEWQKPEDVEFKITVTVDSNEKTITFADNGLGMTMDEVDEYINQIAFSGAQDFMEKYKDKANEDQIIGHFGLGFYSAFMVADKVTIDTLSYQEGAAPVHWESDGGTEYEMEEGDKTSFGTTIKRYLNEESLEFCNCLLYTSRPPSRQRRRGHEADIACFKWLGALQRRGAGGF